MNRKNFIKSLLLLPAGAAAMKLHEFHRSAGELPASDRMPVLFIGHGSPMNAIEDNNFTQTLTKLGQRLERPKAILVISAHWLTKGSTSVATSPNPETIYDFGGFPAEMYQIKYNAPGSPDFAKQVVENVKSIQVHEDHEMGFDHGAWTILKHIYPTADIPVFQMSIDYNKPPQWHFDLAAELKSLREKGVLIIGSGNIVHNLRMVTFNDFSQKYDWAVEFDEQVKQRISAGDYGALVNYQQFGRAAQLSVPTNDHYLPMLYSLGLLDKKEAVNFTYEEVVGGSISMRCFESS
ncbi:MAG: 4,5-DOPA dioxygenase extradiol [Saprospiraceae bacterium]|nr:4,5-DOPA dioxygenase extradiol [Saprospiraceae bacterium]MCF8249380.1 4,5-DOPA dioxygenase extradiol [Saprospiraceae bacterium]MCF8311509.1 4,5-DOPA dioxygenase extradiol [Saprospiraceae bacterium]MCF8439999.1 4,5-DOPA dioxygenase extradiol [Saprospiraceae bacterium]